jgi:hypothetical protein
LNIDLINSPKLALDPPTSYKIMSLGMRKGLFTGRGLEDYIHDQVCDYRNARRIINGLDQTDKITRYAQKLEITLQQSLITLKLQCAESQIPRGCFLRFAVAPVPVTNRII